MIRFLFWTFAGFLLVRFLLRMILRSQNIAKVQGDPSGNADATLVQCDLCGVFDDSRRLRIEGATRRCITGCAPRA
jgi:hypothetical protein